jgi:hypothetical protein
MLQSHNWLEPVGWSLLAGVWRLDYQANQSLSGCRILTDSALSQALKDKLRFGFCIGHSVISVGLCQLHLELLVSLTDLCLISQEVPKNYVPRQFGAVLGAYIKMMRGPPARLSEGLTIRDALITLMGIARHFKLADGSVRSFRLTTTSMSMTGLAASPGTEVLPTCSIVKAVSPKASASISLSEANTAGHAGS